MRMLLALCVDGLTLMILVFRMGWVENVGWDEVVDWKSAC